jgi:hypothetical protein
MAGPDLGFLELLNTFLPYVVAAVVGLVALVGFFYYRMKYMPEIARVLTKCYHSRGLPVFIQDEMGNVELQICDKKFPEGIVHTKRNGWFLLPTPPSPTEEANSEEEQQEVKRGPGRPPKQPVVDEKDPKSQDELEKYAETYGTLMQVPTLRGLGKQVFFGSATASALSNLKAIAHANLPDVRKLSPQMYQKTQLDALATGNRIEGLKMSGKETTKLLMYAIIAAVPIACFAIAAWLLSQKPVEIALLFLH